MDISFIILTWNSEKYIKSCLNSILVEMSSDPFSYEIIIVDNGSKDNTIKILKNMKNKNSKLIKNIFLKNNTGTTYSRNIALNQAKGNFLILLDSDIVLCQGVINPVIKFLKKNEKAGLVAPKLIYPNGSIQKSTDEFPTIFSKIIRLLFLRQIEKRDFKKAIFRKFFEVDYAISAMWVLKYQVFKKVGFFDEKIFYAPEDVDYCLRVWMAGYKIYYYTDVSICCRRNAIFYALR